MSLDNNLTTAELQNLLMDETKKLTTALREGHSIEQRELIRKRIEEIQKLLEDKKHKDGAKNSVPNHESM